MAVPVPTSRAALSCAAGAALLGFGPILVRLSELGPQATAFWRMALALPVLIALAALQRARKGREASGRIDAAPLLLAGVFFGVDIALWHWGLSMTTVANATLLSNMTPILAVAGGWLLFKERPHLGFFVGAALGLAGAAALSAAGERSGQGGLGGDALALFAAVWYAAYLMMMRTARRAVSTLDAMVVTTVAAALVTAASTAIAGEAWLPRTLEGWAAVGALALLVHVGGQGLIAAGLGALPLSVSTVLLWVQPVAAALLGWALFDEALGPLSLLGGVLVLAGVFIAQRTQRG